MKLAYMRLAVRTLQQLDTELLITSFCFLRPQGGGGNCKGQSRGFTRICEKKVTPPSIFQ